jgi:hypothetical protein
MIYEHGIFLHLLRYLLPCNLKTFKKPSIELFLLILKAFLALCISILIPASKLKESKALYTTIKEKEVYMEAKRNWSLKILKLCYQLPHVILFH